MAITHTHTHCLAALWFSTCVECYCDFDIFSARYYLTVSRVTSCEQCRVAVICFTFMDVSVIVVMTRQLVLLDFLVVYLLCCITALLHPWYLSVVKTICTVLVFSWPVTHFSVTSNAQSWQEFPVVLKCSQRRVLVLVLFCHLVWLMLKIVWTRVEVCFYR